MERLKAMLAQLTDGKNLSKGEFIRLDQNDLEWLCDESIKALQEDPVLVRISAPLNIVGDVHGQFTDLMKFLDYGGSAETTKYLFLGDYVDRGSNSIETISTLLCLKLLYRQNVFLLRGNHETRDISELYGFADECKDRYSSELWEKFNDVFRYLPLAAVISHRIFCVHGGLSQHLRELSQIEEITRPIDVPESGFISDLLWADPSTTQEGYTASERGTSYTFGADVADAFLEKNDLDLICRAHQVVLDGFEFPFFPNQSVVTVFSAPDYLEEFGNKGAMLKIAEDLTCSFLFVDPPAGRVPDLDRVKVNPM
jgi:serine/threonine-protein phosphatase PP1 catalytic subunit